MKRLLIAMIATALTATLVPAVANAHRVSYDSTVTAKYTKPDKKDPYATATFGGAVASSKARCQKNRTVTVNLQGSDGTTRTVGTDQTDATGAWVFQTSDAASGTYFAEVSKKVIRKNKKHRHVCRGAISRTVNVK